MAAVPLAASLSFTSVHRWSTAPGQAFTRPKSNQPGVSGRRLGLLQAATIIRLRALLLDALGTLVALEPPAPRLRAELQSRLGVTVSLAEAETAIAAEIAYYREHLDDGRDAATLRQLRNRCTEELRKALPGPPRELALELLMASLKFSAYPDAQPAIATARADGILVAVVSNWDVSLHGVLERLGFAVDGVITSAEVGARKPAPAIFKRALALLDVAPAEAVHVGDSLQEDVAGALAAGIEPVLLARDGRAGPPGVRTIATLAELA
jgi:putative hydrolase of the HAD superfamily